MSSSDRSLLSSALFLLFKIDNTAPSSGCPENCSRKCFCQLEADRERWIQSKPKFYKYALNYTACLENNGTNNYQTITSTIRHSEDNDMEAACSFSHVKGVFTLSPHWLAVSYKYGSHRFYHWTDIGPEINFSWKTLLNIVCLYMNSGIQPLFLGHMML